MRDLLSQAAPKFVPEAMMSASLVRLIALSGDTRSPILSLYGAEFEFYIIEVGCQYLSQNNSNVDAYSEIESHSTYRHVTMGDKVGGDGTLPGVPQEV